MKAMIVVANSAEAKILKTDNLRIGELELVKELNHPKSRKKAAELVSDQPGHYKTDSGAISSYSKKDPKEVEAEHFAVQLSNELKSLQNKNRFKNLILITPSHFHGVLDKHFSAPHDLEIKYIAKDYTKHTLTKLHTNIKGQLFF